MPEPLSEQRLEEIEYAIVHTPAAARSGGMQLLAEVRRLRAENELLRLGITVPIGPAQADWLSVAMKTYAAQETKLFREALTRLVVVCDACLFERNYSHPDAPWALQDAHEALREK